MGAKIVVADDDAAMREWIRVLLRRYPFDVVEVASGWELLHVLAEDGPFALVITDLRMPAPNGLNVVTMARTAGVDTPFLVVTAFPDEELLHALSKVKGAHLLGKPFRASELHAAVSTLLELYPAGAPA